MTNWTQKTNWIQKPIGLKPIGRSWNENWTQKIKWINETIVNIKNVTVLILSCNNKSYHCFNNTNNSILSFKK